MKKLILIILAVGMLSGCVERMTNEQIIEVVKFCEEAGLEAVPYQGFDVYIDRIQCEPITKPTNEN